MPVIALFIALFVGAGGLTFAASSALPGDRLYPIKVHVDEPIVAALQLDAHSRAQFDTTLVARRLEEAEQLAAVGRLTEQTRMQLVSDFSAHVSAAKANIASLNVSGKAMDAADVSSSLESVLHGHAEVLRLLPTTTEDAREQVHAVLKQVDSEATDAADIRTHMEERVAFSAETDQQTAAQASIKDAQRAIDDVQHKIDQSSDTQATASAQARLTVASGQLAQAQVQFDAKSYNAAFVQAKAAKRTAKEAQLLLHASLEGQLHLNIDTDSSSSSSLSSLSSSSLSSSSFSSSVSSSSASSISSRHFDRGDRSSSSTTSEDKKGNDDRQKIDVDDDGQVDVKTEIDL